MRVQLDHKKEELSDIVKYLELEEQFSTKKSPVSECFPQRRNQKYILNAKKAYNICECRDNDTHTPNMFLEELTQLYITSAFVWRFFLSHVNVY